MKKALFILLLLPLATLAQDNLTYDKPVQSIIKSGSIDYFIQGKGSPGEKNNQICEDGLFFNDHYLAVFDGATDKSGKKYDGKKGGRVSRDIIQDVFQSLPPNTDKKVVLQKINEKFKEFYNKNSDMDFEKNPLFRPTATLIWYNLDSNELVAIGDSKARIDGVNYNDEAKYVDVLNSALRVKILKDLKLTPEQIEENDLGRFYIMPLLQRQSEFQNNPNAPKAFQYWAIDGFNIPENELKTWKFDKKPKVIELSSDGYETYAREATIESYENQLKSELQSDPLRIENPSTKGVIKGNYTFDDRAILIYRSK
ncbi:hypothetical protein RO04_04125 [Aggregatibacter actinomycetemcomitans]|uniref:hypothetical protein n=1 Tax=Aggregatibacter actinomycetemcomitans TaxID=714 RepID=UPI00022AE184|nr:hypothetical protein [Aggregatibacter actinomycetemcomitans]KOE70292.1 hypothetical protein D18P1_0303460 [Aggregatibacter actinomycetemcomitans serotype f str. D18P1]KYK88352.1 hypothetical protein SC29R_03365 [Aggregatibacter actinomycetemcomitans serotype f str. SC29R]MBN6062026.1 hypothetical protein [Aggregatibacter actinomycetemcomitans]OZV18981.1 hypothetical protein RO04_04125 [Aggregatibacter actinomycetemcomitans]UEL53533.1 hypothetical protein KO461_00395 [Aggregatibacter actinom